MLFLHEKKYKTMVCLSYDFNLLQNFIDNMFFEEKKWSYILPFKITTFTSILMRADAYTGKGGISKINVKPPCSWFPIVNLSWVQ